MKLYEINRAIEDVIENGFSIDEETGEVLFMPEDLDGLQEERKAKIEATAQVFKNYLALADAIKEEEAKLKARREQATKKAERLKEYLGACLSYSEKFTSPTCAISFRPSSKVIVEDIDKIPEEYLRTKTTIEADKTAIKKALDEGKEITGCHIEENKNVIIK